MGSAGPLGAAVGAGAPGGTSEREALIVLTTVDGLGPATLARLVERLGSARSILDVAAGHGGAAAIEVAGSGESRIQSIEPAVAHAVVVAARDRDAILERLDRAGVRAVTVEDQEYPPRLRAIELPPHVLFVQGSLSALIGPRSVAIVGTRRPSDAGRAIAARIGSALARANAVVISGLALGIDGAAHAAVVAEQAPTVAVLGGGHGELYPAVHRRLAERILATGGAVVAELPPWTPPVPGTFPRRNRVISGLADATIVVEAPVRSGALLTAGWALAQGRGCFLVPGDIDSRTAAGCLSFLRDYPAEARIVTGIPQLLEDLGLAEMIDPLDASRSLARPVAAVLVELGEGARRVAAALVDGRSTADELVAATGLPIGAVLASLTLLEARDLAVSAYGRYRPAGRLAGVTPHRPRP